MNQDQLASDLEIKRSRLGAYEEGRAAPGIGLLAQIASYFGISIDVLVSTDLLKLGNNKMMKIGDDRILFPITVDVEENDTIEVINNHAVAGYLQGYSDPEYIQDLERFNLPFIPTGKHRAFPIKGDSMPPVEEGSFVVGRFVDGLSEIHDGNCYVILTRDEGIVYKRLYNKMNVDGTFQFYSDNKKYPPYNVKPEDILEVWEYTAHINTEKYEPEELNKELIADMFRSLQVEIETLKSRLDKKS